MVQVGDGHRLGKLWKVMCNVCAMNREYSGKAKSFFIRISVTSKRYSCVSSFSPRTHKCGV